MMEKIKYRLSVQQVEGGMLAVYVICSQYQRTLEIDTSVRIFSDEWDRKNGRVINNPNAKKLNQHIHKTVYELEGFEMDFDGDFTLSKLYEIWQGREASHDFYTLMSYYIDNRSIRQSTKEIHKRVLTHLKHYKSECLVSELTEEYVKGFASYMEQIGLAPGTISMHMHALRCYYNIAKKNFGSKVPAGSFDYYHEKLADRLIYHLKSLTDDDIRILENYCAKEDVSEEYKLRINRFLFMSYTGTRISDFISLTKNNITIENGKMWLTYTSVKTDTYIRVPLSVIFDGRAEQIISKYEHDIDAFFRIPNKSSYNTTLNTAIKGSGINKYLTAHMARHTCASRLINRDIPVTTIQKIIGHRTLKMTMVYAKTNENTLVRQLSR